MKRSKALAILQRRQRSHDLTVERQRTHNFKPNATGPEHEQRRPGSMNGHKSSPAKRKRY